MTGFTQTMGKTKTQAGERETMSEKHIVSVNNGLLSPRLSHSSLVLISHRFLHTMPPSNLVSLLWSTAAPTSQQDTVGSLHSLLLLSPLTHRRLSLSTFREQQCWFVWVRGSIRVHYDLFHLSQMISPPLCEPPPWLHSLCSNKAQRET